MVLSGNALNFQMPKRKQKIVIVIEPKYFPYHTPSMIGDIFAAQFAIDENESNEILKIVQLQETFFNSEERLNTGMDLISPFYIERRGKSGFLKK